MTDAITEPRVRTLDTSRVDVCPVGRLHAGPGEGGFRETTIPHLAGGAA